MIREIHAKSILRKSRRIDSWFISSYGINLYRGCAHNCVYCDGRTEKYRVEGEFGRDIDIKINALELLARELDPERRRKPFANGFRMICGGVSDAYQPFEKKYKLCRQVLELLHRHHHPVHILTKSTLVERDMDLLQKINRRTRALVSFSFSSVDDKISSKLEPGVPAPARRLEMIRKFKDKGFSCGMFLMPVIPFVTDSREMMERTIAEAKKAGVDYIIFAGMTLKEGRQKDYFMDFLKRQFPELVPEYSQLFGMANKWGSPRADYANSINRAFADIASSYQVPKRIPADIYRPLVTTSELVFIMLEQLDYLAKVKGRHSPYGFASHVLSGLDRPVESLNRRDLLAMKGIGPFTADLVLEMAATGRCGFYEKML